MSTQQIAACPQCGTDTSGRFCPACGTAMTTFQTSAPTFPPRADSLTAPRAAPSANGHVSTPRRRWLPGLIIAGVVAGAAVVVAVLLLVLGGSPSQPKAKQAVAPQLTDAQLAGQALYTPRGGPGFVAMMPAG